MLALTLASIQYSITLYLSRNWCNSFWTNYKLLAYPSPCFRQPVGGDLGEHVYPIIPCNNNSKMFIEQFVQTV